MALLQQLTAKQLTYVIENDPLIYAGERVVTSSKIADLKKIGLSDSLIKALMLSWIAQLTKARKFGSAHDFCCAYDAWQNTHYARENAVQFAQHLLSELPNIAWHHWLRAGLNALKDGRKSRALKCFDEMNVGIGFEIMKFMAEPRTEKTARKHNVLTAALDKNALLRKKILQEAICEADFDLIDASLNANVAVQHKLNLRQLRDLRHCVTTLFVEGHLNRNKYDRAWEFLTEHGSDSEKRACLNAAAHLGDTQLLIKLSEMWNIDLTARHWKKAMAKQWYDQPNGGDSYNRVYIARKLIAHSDRYLPILMKALRHNRVQALKDGRVIRAHEISQELEEPLTIEELTRVLRLYGNDRRITYQKTEVPFATKLFIETVGRKPELVEPEPKKKPARARRSSGQSTTTSNP